MLSSQRELIVEIFSQALKNIRAPESAQVLLERPKQASHGDIACTSALQCAKAMKLPPRKIAEMIVCEIQKDKRAKSFFKEIDIAGPGFINLTLSDEAKQEVIREILRQQKLFGCKPAQNKSVLIEYVSANPTGPLHLGHARQGALGDVLSNLYRSQGWNVSREFYYNDAGMQISNLTKSVRARAQELMGKKVVFLEKNDKETEKERLANEAKVREQVAQGAILFPPDGYRGDYVTEIARKYLAKESVTTFDGGVIKSSGDIDDLDTLKKFSVALLRNEQYDDLQAFGVSFDSYFLESSVYADGQIKAAIDAMDKTGKLYEADGALWFKSTDYGDDKDRVVRKQDGTFTYFVPDVAYHINKFNRGYTRALNIQGTDHFGTTARVRAGVQAYGQANGIEIPKDFPDYLLHTMTHIIKDGQEVKMSKRAGTYVTLRDLLDWIGKDAARLFLVSRKCDAEFNIDVDLAVSHSDDNPVFYLQYAHARICSIFVQAQEKNFKVLSVEEAAACDLSSLTDPSETALLNLLSDYPQTLSLALRELAPHVLVNYLSDLAAAFHSFYNNQRVLVDDDSIRNAKMALLLAIKQVFSNGFDILGITAVERLDRETE